MLLADAVDMQQIEQVGYYTEQVVDVNQSGWFSKPPIVKAIRQGNVLLVQYLIDSGAKIDINCLEEAIKVESLPIVKCLVEHGVEVNKNGFFDVSLNAPVLQAIRRGNAPIVQYLVENGARVDEECLNVAISKRSLPIVKCLVENGVSVNKQRHFEPLRHATHTGNIELVQYLVESGAEISTDCVEKAAEIGSLSIMKYYVERGVNITRTKSFSKRIMKKAIKSGNISLVKYLVKNGIKLKLDEEICRDILCDIWLREE